MITVDNIYHSQNVSSKRNETLTVTCSHSAKTVEFRYGFKLLRLALRFHILSCPYRVSATPKRKNFVSLHFFKTFFCRQNMWNRRLCVSISQIFYIFVLRVEITTIFERKVVTISARNTIMQKICKAIFSTHYNIFQPNFEIVPLSKDSLQEFLFFLSNQHLWCRGHHACLSSWETRVQSLVGPLLKVLKQLKEKVLPLH